MVYPKYTDKRLHNKDYFQIKDIEFPLPNLRADEKSNHFSKEDRKEKKQWLLY